eukprot:TRINITY_DN4471_c0_g1_i1.p1 TRINITY_DN4471_c0_g1~~TRINITY_DN4471_c0_g1_i1.p1  ORF type:complete len:440 (+),score=90.15 TRINITY_DN4471_c0_g1_i1:108-1427(+)
MADKDSMATSESESNDADVSETAPLLAVAKRCSEYRSSSGRRSSISLAEIEALQSTGVSSNMLYKASILGTWEAFGNLSTTVWTERRLWQMMGRLALLSLCVALWPIFTVHDPSKMNVAGLLKVSQFLNVVVGLLLGFFLSNAIKRWYACVDGFLLLLDSVRNLQMQFVALGVPDDDAGQILRHAYASGVLLYEQLQFDHKKLSSDFDFEGETANVWAQLSNRPVSLGYRDKKLLDKTEIGLLRDTRDPPSVIWTWIAASIGRLAQDGFIPPMASPTYGRIMNLIQSAHGGIRDVRAAICVQMPWNYVHILSSLVHINNAINAVILGLVGGLVSSLLFQRYDLFFHYHGSKPSVQEMEQELEQLFATYVCCITGPFVYQALLLIGISLSQPFDAEEAQIPMDRLLNQLEEDMCDGVSLIENMEDVLGFEPPFFKKKEGP